MSETATPPPKPHRPEDFARDLVEKATGLRVSKIVEYAAAEVFFAAEDGYRSCMVETGIAGLSCSKQQRLEAVKRLGELGFEAVLYAPNQHLIRISW